MGIEDFGKEIQRMDSEEWHTPESTASTSLSIASDFMRGETKNWENLLKKWDQH